MREYVYFSERLARKVVEENRGLSRRPKTTLAFRPGGIGGDISWGGEGAAPGSIGEWADAVDKVVGERAAWGWDPNAGAPFLRGRSLVFFSELVGGPQAAGSVMAGATYLWQDVEVNLCLFGSRHNVDGAVPGVDASRKVGWTSSSNVGLKQLLEFMPTGPFWDEDQGFERATGVDDDDLVWNAANIMRGQGIVGDGNRRHAEAPSLRGHTILEGDFEWLARIYWWRSGDPQFHNIAVGAPIYVRSVSDPPWTLYAAVAPGEWLHELSLAPGHMSPDSPVSIDGQASARRRPWWWPF